MNSWPDAERNLYRVFVKQLCLRSSSARNSYHYVLDGFQRCALACAGTQPPSRSTIEYWLKERARSLPEYVLLGHARLVDRFLDWLVANGHLECNPLANLRASYSPRGTTPVVRALLRPDPDVALEAIRPLPRFASHLGPLMRKHVTLMQSLGYRYQTIQSRLARFDRFLQTRPDLEAEPLKVLVREWANAASTSQHAMDCIDTGRVIAKALQRNGIPVEPPESPRGLRGAVKRSQRRPYIYTPDEVAQLLKTASAFPSPRAPLRPIALYTMIVLAYCAGLRLGEIVRLKVQDIDLETASISVRDTKFFKSRRLPVTTTVMTALSGYLHARLLAGAPADGGPALFWNIQTSRGYSQIRVSKLLVQVIRDSGLKPLPGRAGPRVHDLRHAMAVNRMTAWYRDGINPQVHLPYLATYLGHASIKSTLVYLTTTPELLQQASERFEVFGAHNLGESVGGESCE
jgi:integrase/recombinase XerD